MDLRAVSPQRLLVIAVALYCVAFGTAVAQEAKKTYRIGVLERQAPEAHAYNFGEFRQAMRELGYVEGKNLRIEYRSSEGRDEQNPVICSDFVRSKVYLIMFRGSPAGLACKSATNSIPIILSGSGDPVGDGLVASFAKPGGNVTGFTTSTGELAAKRLEVLRDLLPKARHFGAVINTGNPAQRAQWQRLQSAAKDAGIRVDLLDVRKKDDLQPAFEQAKKLRVEALYVGIDTVTETNRHLIADLAIRNRLPTMNAEVTYVQAGGLVSYGANLSATYRRAAITADKILRGAKPGDIPVEQPSVFELSFNLKTAKELGLAIPKELLFRADRVIE